MKFKLDSVEYGLNPNQSLNVFRNEDTIGYVFINNGNTPVEINSYTLLPNTSWKTFEAGCEDLTIYRLRFIQNNNLYTTCGTTNAKLSVIIYSKVYDKSSK